MPLQGLDADTDLRPYISRMKAGGLSFAMRYLKNLTPAEFEALKAAQLAVGLIYETKAQRALGGAEAGAADGTLAKRQAKSLWQAYAADSEVTISTTACIFATVDTDIEPSQINAVIDYFSAFSTAIWPEFKTGAYACGYVLKALEPPGLAQAWLAGAMGWAGSRDYLAASPDCFRQGPTLSEGGSWALLDWPDIGTPYDPNIASSLDWAV